MDHSPRVLDKLLEQCVEVSVERKSEILCEWAGKRMCHGLPLESCASCGIRDPDRDYHVVRLKELPSVFRLDKDACARRARLGSVDMVFPRNGAGDVLHDFLHCPSLCLSRASLTFSALVPCRWLRDPIRRHPTHHELLRGPRRHALLPAPRVCRRRGGRVQPVDALLRQVQRPGWRWRQEAQGAEPLPRGGRRLWRALAHPRVLRLGHAALGGRADAPLRRAPLSHRDQGAPRCR